MTIVLLARLVRLLCPIGVTKDKALAGADGEKVFYLLYNFVQERFRMSRPVNFRLRESQHPRWLVLIIVLAICGLTVSLATRTFRLAIPQTVKVQSGDFQAVRQHLDRDAVPWAAPLPVLSTLPLPVFYPRFAPAGPPIPGVLFDESLSNRPPPFC